ncbi:MAG: hypothetical protein IPI95_04050 [Flavobacteriales bacterium]|nr:hypothetical protein [Flavobacteriales bacterium]
MEDPPKWVMRGQKRWATFVPKNIMTMDIISRRMVREGQRPGRADQCQGERELGLKCYQEFNTIGQVYAPRIAELGMQLALLQMKDKGMDPAAMEQVKKAMGQ